MADSNHKTNTEIHFFKRVALSAGVVLWAASIAACGSSNSGTTSEDTNSAPASAEAVDDTLASSAPIDTSEFADILATPTFHRQPVDLSEPESIDEDGSAASAALDPKSIDLRPDLFGLETRQLTDEKIAAYLAMPQQLKDLSAKALTPSVPVVYTPAQIRAAYRLPALPASTTGLSAQNAASLGAGQTIYIVNAYHNPNTAYDLTKFSQKFGLPVCTSVAAPKTAAKLSAPSATGCQLMVVYSAAGGNVSPVAPPYNAGWASEIALDVQWAHAIAPLARIVLIEASSASLGAMSDAIKLAANFGPGVVSMSFGALEGSWVNSANTVFNGAGMTYVAATGDNGYGVSWPAVAPNVLAAGGTTLNYKSAGTRSEVTWSGTGGGVSAFVPMPAYQQSLTMPGQPTTKPPGATTIPKYRGVADLAFNADPYTGQYVAITPPGSASTYWYSFGGTSMSTPQLAGIVAIANAQRALKKLPVLGVLNTALYANFAPKSTAYLQSFNDVTAGRNGGCTACNALIGYDIPTGLGTPRSDYFLSILTSK